MLIVIEGPDNAGKSTLAAYLSERLNIAIRHSGGPSKYPGEIYRRIDQFHNDDALYICDRHPCVSQNIYLKALGLDGEPVDAGRITRFYETQPLIIYCRNKYASMDGHRSSEHGAGIGFTSNDYEQQVERNIAALCENYDRWAMRHANIFYRIGDDMNRIVQLVDSMTTRSLHEAVSSLMPFDPVRDIEDFHRKYGLAYDGLPRLLPQDMEDFRKDFHHEEIDEYDRHATYARYELDGNKFDSYDNANFVHHLEEMLDACVDAVYVILGTAHLQGFNFREAWRRVHSANMKKIRTSSRLRGKRGESKFDVIKPPGWVKPRHTDLVERHAHTVVLGVDEAKHFGAAE